MAHVVLNYLHCVGDGHQQHISSTKVVFVFKLYKINYDTDAGRHVGTSMQARVAICAQFIEF